MRFGKVVSIERTAAFLAVMFVFSVRPAFPAGPDDFATAKAMYEKRLFNVSYQYFHDFILTYPDSRNAGEAQFYLGESLFALGDYERAITEYRLAVVNYPESLSLPRASIRLGDCFDHLGDAVKAVYYYKKAVNRAVDSDDIYDGYSKLGGLYFKQGDYSAAIDTYNGFINNYGIKDTPGTIYYRLALCYYLISDYKSTETALNEAAGSDFDDPALLSYVMGRVDYKQGSLENAVEHFETALSDGTNSPVYSDLLFQYGVTLAATGDYEASIGIVEEATQGEMDGDLRAGFLYLSGYSLFNTGDWTGARAALMQSLEIKPDIATSEEAEFLIAESLMESGEYEEAELKYRTIVEKGNRWSQQAMYRLAWLAFGNGDMRTAYDRFGDAGVHPGELAPYCSYWQAECLLRMGDEYEGLNQLKYILKEMPESPLADNALFRFAKILIKTGSTDEGIANLSLLIDRYDESALCDDSAYLIARTYSDQKRYDEAISGYYELISSYPDSSYVSQAYYDIGMIYYDTRDYDKAVTVFDSIVSVYPESDVADDALYQSGFCELARSNYKAALSVFEELARLFPNSPLVDDALYRVEMCRYEMGEYSSEIEAAKVYVRKYPASSLCCGLYIKIARYYDRTGTRKKAEKYYLLAEETAKTLEERYDARRYLAEYY
ncbi:MAG: tetratricopeptide repeat protein, partial [bacterium]|nr:tetratricopeptide repeat protein [bacterium]